ncbi:tRNA pseudouridine(38-40) synthase TruA [Kiritimatiellaeota bacterium B1221]|nr:tRNA pseudouridine(38-40) synthase TruA [Kiritimatiellaeota bacterium B1221]
MTSILENNRIAVSVGYDGSDFQGWQVQPGKRTVQDEIEKAFGLICASESPRIHGSGRTDTGVHARGQVFHVDPSRPLSARRWQDALNGVLPDDIRVYAVRDVASDFHARFDAQSKQYRYFILNAPVMPPELRRVRHHVRKDLNVERMREAASLLQGKHDFLSFSANRGKPEQSTIRTLSRMDLEVHGSELCLIAEADGFMYKMVRQLAGALLRVGLGELSPADIQQLLSEPERNHLAPTAPAQALFLWKVSYPEWSSHVCI